MNCDICYEPKSHFKFCKQCVHKQCKTCTVKLESCPFCRVPFYTTKVIQRMRDFERLVTSFIHRIEASPCPQQKYRYVEYLCWRSIRYLSVLSMDKYSKLRYYLGELLKKYKKKIRRSMFFVRVLQLEN